MCRYASQATQKGSAVKNIYGDFTDIRNILLHSWFSTMPVFCDGHFKISLLNDQEFPPAFPRTKSAHEHRQNAIQYLYLHLFTTKFVVILLTLTQKCHISQISNVQKVRHFKQPAADG